jgi:hypothetical protein
MKKIRGFLISLIIFSACHKTENITPQNELSALKNGKNWVNNNSFKVLGGRSYLLGDSCSLTSDSTIDMSLIIYNLDGEMREFVGLSRILPTKGEITLNGYPKCSNVISYFTSVGDGDIISASYSLTKMGNNKLTIDNYEKSTNIINGRFSATFVKVRGVSYEPDTVKFTNGIFKVKLNL